VDFDSTMRRFESSRPSQYLANKIRYFLNRPDLHSDGRPRPHSDALFLIDPATIRPGHVP
jgi:hypothetical protein